MLCFTYLLEFYTESRSRYLTKKNRTEYFFFLMTYNLKWVSNGVLSQFEFCSENMMVFYCDLVIHEDATWNVFC